MNYMDYVDDGCMNAFTLGQKNRMITAIQLYRSTLLTSNGCGVVGISENELKSDFSIYPTYANESINLVTNKVSSYQVTIYSLNGKIVKEKSTKATTNLLLNIAELKNGMYFLKITSDGASFTEKFIKVSH